MGLRDRTLSPKVLPKTLRTVRRMRGCTLWFHSAKSRAEVDERLQATIHAHDGIR